MPTCVRSFSKINLGLVIGPPRPDGFHGLTTLYQTLEAHDLVTVSALQVDRGGGRILITSNDRRVPVDERNTVWKMVHRAVATEAYSHSGWIVSIHIEKRLPMRGGLGAGSANAAAALIALERETEIPLDGDTRLRIAAEVGSDVPLFLLGGAVLGTGRGEQVFPAPDLIPEKTACHVVVALPYVGVSTPQAFRDWDSALRAVPDEDQARESRISLTHEQASDRLGELSRALALALCEPHYSSGVFSAHAREGLARHPLAALVRTGIRNDFEQVVFRQHPLLGTIKRALEAGSIYAALSGSGSALFGLFTDEESAQAAESRLTALHVRSLRTALLGRAAYWEQMHVPAQ